MIAYQTWSNVDPAEDPTLSATMPIQTGQTLVSATVVVTVFSGIDPTPSAITNGLCSVSGAVVSCLKTANTGVNGTTYLFTFTGVTSTGKHVVGSVTLPVVTGGA